MSRLAAKLGQVTLTNLMGAVGLAFVFWEPIYGATLLGLTFIGEATRSAFPPAERPSDVLAKRMDELEARLGRAELRAGMHR